MAAKPVQISLEARLLRRIDADPEVRAHGRSAFIRSAVVLYPEAKRKKQLDREIRKAFKGKASELSAEVEDLLRAQVWPSPEPRRGADVSFRASGQAEARADSESSGRDRRS